MRKMSVEVTQAECKIATGGICFIATKRQKKKEKKFDKSSQIKDLPELPKT
jgi:hypothetical protein